MLIAWILGLSSCGEVKSDDILNPDADFIYYYGKTCSYCVDLDKTLKEKDIYSKNILEKKEVWTNRRNQAEFTALTTSLGLNPTQVGVPFMYVKSTKEHFIWEWNIIPVLEAAIAATWTVEVDVTTEHTTENEEDTVWEEEVQTWSTTTVQ